MEYICYNDRTSLEAMLREYLAYQISGPRGNSIRIPSETAKAISRIASGLELSLNPTEETKKIERILLRSNLRTVYASMHPTLTFISTLVSEAGLPLPELIPEEVNLSYFAIGRIGWRMTQYNLRRLIHDIRPLALSGGDVGRSASRILEDLTAIKKGRHAREIEVQESIARYQIELIEEQRVAPMKCESSFYSKTQRGGGRKNAAPAITGVLSWVYYVSGRRPEKLTPADFMEVERTIDIEAGTRRVFEEFEEAYIKPLSDAGRGKEAILGAFGRRKNKKNQELLMASCYREFTDPDSYVSKDARKKAEALSFVFSSIRSIGVLHDAKNLIRQA